MKNHTIKTPTTELLIVELPKNQNIVFGYYLDQLTIFDPEKDFRDSEINFDGNWELLGKLDEIKEEDAELLVEKVMNGQHYQNYKAIKEKDFANLWCRTATESLLSLIESEIYWENPYEYILQSTLDNFEKSKCDKTEVEIVQDEYNEAEARTFDKTRTLIFVKN